MTINIEREAVVKNNLPMSLAFDTEDGTSAILQALSRMPFASGSQPFARGKSISRVRADAPLAAASGVLIRKSQQDSMTSRLYAGDGWTMRTVRWPSGGAYVSVVAV